MNKNEIVTNDWSNIGSRLMYQKNWPDDPVCQKRHEAGEQCGGCSFFAPFDADWGLCCNKKSRHHLETVFEHFTCPAYVNEGWGPHSFTKTQERHCRCGGRPLESDKVIELKSSDIHYRLTRLTDEEYIESYNDSSIAIAKDFEFYWSFERHLQRKGLDLNLAQMYITLKKLCGENGCFYDHSKGSFCFPFLLEVTKGEKSFTYLLEVGDGEFVKFRIRKLIEPDDRKYGRMSSYKPIENEFSQQEINEFIVLFYGYLADFFKSIAKRYNEFFLKKVPEYLILYGYKDGRFFEESYGSREEYQRAVKALEK